MTISELIKMCENITLKTSIMVYFTVEDFDNATCYWNSCRAESLADSDIKIAKFRIYDDFVAVAMA